MLFHTQAGDGCVGTGEGAVGAWLPAALRDLACQSHLPFLPFYSSFREKRGKPGTKPLSPASSPTWPQISTILALHVPGGLCPDSLLPLAVLFAQSALYPFFKTTLTLPGCLEPSPGLPSPTSLPQLPPVSGPRSGRQDPLARSIMREAWRRLPKHHPLPKA